MTYPFRQSYYHSYGQRKGTLGLDFHMSEGGDGLLDYLGDGGTPPLRGVSANFVNLTDGTIWKMLGWDETAGTLNPADRASDTGYYGPQHLRAVLGEHWPDPNVWSISMEIAGFRAKGPTRAQVESAVLWAAAMKARFPTLRGAFGHHDQSPKGCPGTTVNMLEIFTRIGGHGLWTQEVDMPGLHLRPLGTTDATPLDAFLTARIKGPGHIIFNVATAAQTAVPDGLDLGVVEKAELVGTLPAWAQGDKNGVRFNYGSPPEDHFAVIRDITAGVLPGVPVVDTTAAVNAALDKVRANALASTAIVIETVIRNARPA